jgi:hypothetical protein
MRNKFYSMLPDEFLSACKAKSDIENHLGKIDYYNLKPESVTSSAIAVPPH